MIEKHLRNNVVGIGERRRAAARLKRPTQPRQHEGKVLCVRIRVSARNVQHGQREEPLTGRSRIARCRGFPPQR